MQTFSNQEKAEYQKSIATHPCRQFIHKIVDVNYRGAMTSIAIEFNFTNERKWPIDPYVTLTGVSNRCPTDEQDQEMGFLVSMFNCLQRAKQYL